MTPNLAIIQISSHGFTPPRPGIRLWIPLFLLWIPVLLVSPLLLLILICVSVLGRIGLWRILTVCWGILSGLPGTDVRVEADGHRIVVKLL